MGFDGFIKIKDCPGESTDDKHKEWIEINSFSEGVSQPHGGQMSATGAIAGGRADFQDLSFTKLMDKSSTKLRFLCSKGEHIPEINIELCLATGDKAKYMDYKFTACFVTAVTCNGNAKSTNDGRPTETVTIRFGKVEWTYIHLAKDGKKLGEAKNNWSVVENKGG
ncbi:MAG: type VI secretion system tube protein Hcp [Phycisphaerales bacterium]|jgi:type VI secretion system secreted protein Hcp|nr:type VI secretion system tube protein Hcp [Phycisphaerales bacterium]